MWCATLPSPIRAAKRRSLLSQKTERASELTAVRCSAADPNEWHGRRPNGEGQGIDGIVRLHVVPNAREVLISLYKKTLSEIKAVPENEGYRKAVESFTNHRLRVCQEEEDWEQIEKRIGCGQVEELIEEAQDELKLFGKMIEWDPWGVPDDYECEIIEDDLPIPNTFHITDPRLSQKNST